MSDRLVAVNHAPVNDGSTLEKGMMVRVMVCSGLVTAKLPYGLILFFICDEL